MPARIQATLYLVGLFAMVQPAFAWEAGRLGGICTLEHTTPDASVRLTYDPTGPLYTITWSIDGAWPETGTFAIQFDGAQPNTISTNRQITDGQSVSVADRGFGNVLDGLRNNETATAVLGDIASSIDLAGAAPEVDIFLACEQAPSV